MVNIEQFFYYTLRYTLNRDLGSSTKQVVLILGLGFEWA